jgi:hypothetical protein
MNIAWYGRYRTLLLLINRSNVPCVPWTRGSSGFQEVTISLDALGKGSEHLGSSNKLVFSLAGGGRNEDRTSKSGQRLSTASEFE